MNPERQEFIKLLEDSSLSEIDKISVKFILDFFEKKHIPKMTSRNFVFLGEPGVGKTFFADKLARLCKKEIVYLACKDFHFKHAIRCKSLEDLNEKISNDKEQLILIDDLDFIWNKERYNVLQEDQRHVMGILDLVKGSEFKIMIITLNDMTELKEQMIDRIEVKVKFDFPSDTHKARFLEKEYKEHIDKKTIDFISKNTLGYNYRDIPELIRINYRMFGNRFNKSTFEYALEHYLPAKLSGFTVENGVKISFTDIIGKQDVLKKVQSIINTRKNEKLSQKLGIQRSNFLLFYGPAGTGKTYMAKAIAGELNYPLIGIRSSDIHGLHGRKDALDNIKDIVDLARRYKNSIIFVDEAEKLFGNQVLGEDNLRIGEFNREIEELSKNETNGIIILAINDINRLGYALPDRFVKIFFDYSTNEERSEFIKKKMVNCSEIFEKDIDCNYLVSSTKNMSFREMDRLWNEIIFKHMDEKTTISNDKISKIIKSFRKSDESEAMFG